MLNRHEKFAIFNISIVALAVILFFIIYLTADPGKAKGAWGAIGLVGFSGFGHMFFMRKKSAADVIEDERDKSIKLKSYTGGYEFALVYLILTSVAIYYRYMDAGVVPVDYVLLLSWSGYAVYMLASSLIILVQYRRGTACGTC